MRFHLPQTRALMAVALLAAAASSWGQEVDHWALSDISLGDLPATSNAIKDGHAKYEFTKSDANEGEVLMSSECGSHNPPHWRHYVFTWTFQRDASRLQKRDELLLTIEGKRDDRNLVNCPPGGVGTPYVNFGDDIGGPLRDRTDLPFSNNSVSIPDGQVRTYPAKEKPDLPTYSHVYSIRVGDHNDARLWFNMTWTLRGAAAIATYHWTGVHAGEQDPPLKVNGVVAGGGGNGGGSNGQAKPWDDPAVQQAIDEWLQRSHPGAPPHGRWTQWGQAIGDGVTAPEPPDHGGMSRYEYLWRHAAELHSADMGTLAEYLAGRHSGGGGGGDGGLGGGQVLPTPPPGSPEPSPGVSRTTLQAGVRVVKKEETVQLPVYLINAADLSNMNFEVSFDPSVVRMSVQPQRGDLLGDALFDANPSPASPVKIGFAGSGGVSGTGAVALLTFLATGAPGSQTAISLKVTTANETGGKVPTIDIIHGSIQIPPEDTFDALDASKALAMSVGNLPLDLRLDLDKDGEVTSRDATLILQKVMPRQGR